LGVYTGAAGAVDVGQVQNNTTAQIDSSANLTANGDVNVLATSNKQVSSYAVSLGAAAGVSTAGSVSVWTLGANSNSIVTAKQSSGKDDQNNTDTVLNENGKDAIQSTDSMASGSSPSDGYQLIVPAYSPAGNQQDLGTITQSASTQLTQAAPSGLISSTTSIDGAFATIQDSAVINSNHGSIDVNAGSNVTFTGVVGSGLLLPPSAARYRSSIIRSSPRSRSNPMFN
jgi:hypothetical protein